LSLGASWLLAGTGGAGADKELRALAGKWKLAAAEEGGRPVPKDKLPPISFTVHPDGTATVHTPDAEFKTRSKLDPARAPKTIDIVYLSGPLKGRRQYGIYKVEGDRWTVFATHFGAKAEDRPRDFSTKQKGRLMVWRRVKAEGK
jgi:uncharacterized protein (TIGR03067 family)